MSRRGLIVCVTGGRDYADRAHLFDTLDAIHRGTVYQPPLAEGIHGIATIVHGACGWDEGDPSTWELLRLEGADALADEWAASRGVELCRMPANWTKYGRPAGPRRNTAMAAKLVHLGHHRALVVAAPGNRGTANMVAQARGKQLQVRACCSAHPLAVTR
ncbi:MAG TPA: DUF2493 domain-containing protein [Polyangiales bacterium]|jgi:hypothetical protein|nr:DUF2493 domain-containing protein [Polyangiales bacterium]